MRRKRTAHLLRKTISTWILKLSKLDKGKPLSPSRRVRAGRNLHIRGGGG